MRWTVYAHVDWPDVDGLDWRRRRRKWIEILLLGALFLRNNLARNFIASAMPICATINRYHIGDNRRRRRRRATSPCTIALHHRRATSPCAIAVALHRQRHRLAIDCKRPP